MGMWDYEISKEIRDRVLSVPDDEIREYAKKAAETVSIRRYENGQSDDFHRESTYDEAYTIENLIVMAITAAKHNTTSGHWMPDNIREAASVAEYGVHTFFPGTEEEYINGYITVFCPITKFFRDLGVKLI